MGRPMVGATGRRGLRPLPLGLAVGRPMVGAAVPCRPHGVGRGERGERGEWEKKLRGATKGSTNVSPERSAGFAHE